MTTRDELRDAVIAAIKRLYAEQMAKGLALPSDVVADAALSAIEREHVIVPREKS